MKQIKLNNGMFSIVDDDLFEEMNKHKWTYSRGYVIRHDKYKLIYMHREVNGTPKGFDTDHINGNKLDNTKANLRTASKSQNGCNKGLQSNNKSGYKGVSWHSARKQWRAYIKKNGKHIHIGCFECPKLAALAYNKVAAEIHGNFAKLNSVEDNLCA